MLENMKYKYDDKSRSEKSNDEMNELRMHNLQLICISRENYSRHYDLG